MITFDLNTARHGSYAGAQIITGYYPKADPSEPQQIGWQVTHGGEPIGNPTVNLWDPPVYPAEGCVFLKITPQFEGWLESLQAAGFVDPTGRIESSGFVERYAAECRVLDPRLLEV